MGSIDSFPCPPLRKTMWSLSARFCSKIVLQIFLNSFLVISLGFRSLFSTAHQNKPGSWGLPVRSTDWCSHRNFDLVRVPPMHMCSTAGCYASNNNDVIKLNMYMKDTCNFSFLYPIYYFLFYTQKLALVILWNRVWNKWIQKKPIKYALVLATMYKSRREVMYSFIHGSKLQWFSVDTPKFERSWLYFKSHCLSHILSPNFGTPSSWLCHSVIYGCPKPDFHILKMWHYQWEIELKKCIFPAELA